MKTNRKTRPRLHSAGRLSSALIVMVLLSSFAGPVDLGNNALAQTRRRPTRNQVHKSSVPRAIFSYAATSSIR